MTNFKTPLRGQQELTLLGSEKGAVAQLMESIDQSGSSFMLIKS